MSRAAARRFVGRQRFLERAIAVVHEAVEELRVLSIVGPAGMGKTMLSAYLATALHEKGHRVLWLDVGAHAPSVAALESSLKAALSAEGLAELGELGRGARRTGLADLLIVDAFEDVSGGERWLFHELVPSLGEGVVVVVSNRARFSTDYRARAPWDSLVRELNLDCLEADEARELLIDAGVPHEDTYALIEATSGHPLSLTLLAKEMTYRGARLGDHDVGIVLGDVVEAFLRGITDDRQRLSVAACALARSIDEPLLRAILGGTSAQDDFAWLASLDFVQRTHDGLSLHSAIRDSALRTLTHSGPERRHGLVKSAVDAWIARMPGHPLEVQHQMFMDALYAGRDSGALRTFLPLTGLESVGLVSTGEGLLAPCRELIANHEGVVSAALFTESCRAGLTKSLSVTEAASSPVAVLGVVSLPHSEAPIPDDPLTVAAHELAMEWVADAPGRRVAFFRWFCSRDDYQAFGPGTSSLMCAGPFALAQLERTHDDVLFYVSPPERWMTLAPHFGLSYVDGHDVDWGGRRYGAFRGPADLARLGSDDAEAVLRSNLRYQAYELTGLPPAGAPPREASSVSSAPVAPVDVEVLRGDVRQALSHLGRRRELAKSPLARLSTVVRLAAHAGGDVADAITTMLERACGSLKRSHDYQTAAELLRTTYFDGGMTQEAAAATLGMAYGTYRYQHRRAVALLAAEIVELEAEG